MTHQVNKDPRSADTVVQAFADASVDFDAQVFQAYLETYPEHSDRLKSYAKVWLMSSRASVDEIAEQDIPAEQMLKAQSRLLMAWEQAIAPAETQDEQEAATRLNAFEGEEGLRDLTKALLESDDEEEDVLVMEYLDPGLRDEPKRIRKKLANRIRCSPEAVPSALVIHRSQQHVHFSAKGKPEIAGVRTWAEAVEGLAVSDERKRELLRDD